MQTRRTFLNTGWKLGAAGLFVPTILRAQGVLAHRRKAFRTVAASSSYLLEENFETGSAPSGWTTDAAMTWDISTPTLQGSYCARHKGFSNNPNYKSFTSQTEVWCYCLFQHENATNGFAIGFRDSGGTDRARFILNSAGGGSTVQSLNSSFEGTGNTVGTMSVDVTYHCWFHYKAHASTGILEVAFSTDGTKPTSGDNYKIKSNCTVNIAVEQVYFSDNGDNTSSYYDRILVSSTAIGDNP